MGNIAIVTAFFDIGRSQWTGQINGYVAPPYLQRTTDDYFHNFERMLRLDNDIIVYTSKDLAARFEPYHQRKKNLLVIAIDDWKLLFPEIRAKTAEVQASPTFQSMIAQPWNPEYWNVDYIMVNFLKSAFVKHAIDSNFIGPDTIAWMDFGYHRTDATIPCTSWQYNFNPTRMHLFSLYAELPGQLDLLEVIKRNAVFIQGCHIVGPKNMWGDFHGQIVQQMQKLLVNNLVDDDQTLLLMSLYEKPENFELHYIDAANGGWFQLLTKFNNAAHG